MFNITTHIVYVDWCVFFIGYTLYIYFIDTLGPFYFIILEVVKVLTKISKIAGCEAVLQWIKPCTNHLFWSATSTFSGNGLVILAKFKSFLHHVINKHSNLPDRLFDKCAHDADIADRKWLKEGRHQLKSTKIMK